MPDTKTWSVQFSVVNYLTELLHFAATQRISDLHIEPLSDHWRIRCRCDGLLFLYGTLPLSAGLSLLNRIKVLANCDIAEKRIAQDGSFSDQACQRDFRVSTCPTIYGEKAVLRCLNPQKSHLALADLGMNDAQLSLLQRMLKIPHGLIVVTGPTGSGKTVTLYSALLALQTISVNIATVEDPVEIALPGLNQIQVNLKAGLSFTTILRALLRQDPDIMMIGEMRDLTTIDIALHAAQTGHLVLSTLHTNSAAEAIIRLLQMGVLPYQISSSIRLIMAQRLVRTLCRQCSGAGCTDCQQGYAGRTGIYELLPMTDDLSTLIDHQPTRQHLQLYVRDQRIVTLWQHGLAKVTAGFTTETELRRVAEPDQPS